MTKLNSLEFLVFCIADYLKGEKKENQKKFLNLAYTKLHNQSKEIELLEIEKFEIALSHIEMIIGRP